MPKSLDGYYRSDTTTFEVPIFLYKRQKNDEVRGAW